MLVKCFLLEASTYLLRASLVMVLVGELMSAARNNPQIFIALHFNLCYMLLLVTTQLNRERREEPRDVATAHAVTQFFAHFSLFLIGSIAAELAEHK